MRRHVFDKIACDIVMDVERSFYVRRYDQLEKKQQETYQVNDKKIWNVLKNMTVREVALSSIKTIAEEAGVGRNTVYNHKMAYHYIMECRIKEAERRRELRKDSIYQQKKGNGKNYEKNHQR